MRHRRCPAALVLGLAVLPGVPRAHADEPSQPYALTIESDLKLRSEALPRPQELHASTELDYALAAKDGGEELTIEAVAVRARIGEKPLTDSRMSRRGLSVRLGEQEASEVPYEKAPPALRTMLDQFGRPAAVFPAGAGAEGDDASPRVLVPPDSSLVENGLIALARLFHVPFPKDRDRWEAPAAVSLSSGQYARGTLTYEKAGAAPDGRVTVRVSGELKAEGRLAAGEIRNGVYKVSGEQVYDPTARRWASGTLTFDVAFDLATPGEPTTSASGTMTVTLADAARRPPG